MATWTNRWDKDHRDKFGKSVTSYEWYDTVGDADFYRDRFMKAINRLRYKSGIWKRVRENGLKNLVDGDLQGWDRVYVFLNDVRKLAGKPEMDREFFDEGINYRNIFDKNYEYARDEFWLLCWGDW